MAAAPHAPAGDAAADLADQARPIEPKSNLQAEIGDLDLPPEDLVDDLDNSQVAAAESEDDGETVTLEFVGDDLPEETFQLRHPFRWDGAVVSSVTVRQLTTAAMSRIARRVSAQKSWDLFEIYAEMTGLPAKVLRSIPAVDGRAIQARAWDFLPPFLR